MFWWARVEVVRGLSLALSCAGEEGGADTSLLPSLETLRGTLGLRLLRGVTEFTILLDNNNLLLADTELQDSESTVIPGGARQRHCGLNTHMATVVDY